MTYRNNLAGLNKNYKTLGFYSCYNDRKVSKIFGVDVRMSVHRSIIANDNQQDANL